MILAINSITHDVETGANSLTSNSEVVVMIAENTRFAVTQLEKAISPFKIRG